MLLGKYCLSTRCSSRRALSWSRLRAAREHRVKGMPFPSLSLLCAVWYLVCVWQCMPAAVSVLGVGALMSVCYRHLYTEEEVQDLLRTNYVSLCTCKSVVPACIMRSSGPRQSEPTLQKSGICGFRNFNSQTGGADDRNSSFKDQEPHSKTPDTPNSRNSV